MRVLSSFLTIVLFTGSALAQVQSEQNSPTQTQPAADNSSNLSLDLAQKDLSHIFSINFIPLFGVFGNSIGLGLGYQFILNEHYSLGTSLYYNKNIVTGYSPHKLTFQFVDIVLEARYKISPFSEDGFYVGLGLDSSGTQGEIKMESFINDWSENASTSYQWETRIVPRLGYLWAQSGKRMYGDLSLAYGPIDKADATYESSIENLKSPSMTLQGRKVGANLTFSVGFVF